MGRHTKKGGYMIDWARVRSFVVPDLEGFTVRTLIMSPTEAPNAHLVAICIFVARPLCVSQDAFPQEGLNRTTTITLFIQLFHSSLI